MKLIVFSLLLLILLISYLGSRHYCICSTDNTGIQQISWAGLNRISKLNCHDDYKDYIFKLCSKVCRNFDMPLVNINTGMNNNFYQTEKPVLSNNNTNINASCIVKHPLEYKKNSTFCNY